MNQEMISLTGDLVGPGALQRIPGKPSGQEEELCINAMSVTGIDSFGAVAIQTAIHQHLAANNQSAACVWPPNEPETQRRLYSLLGLLPDRCKLPEDFRVPERDPRIIIPTMAVADIEEAQLIGRTIKAAGSTAHLGSLRLAVRQAQVVATSAVALLDNALSHPTDNPCNPVISCAIEAGSRNVQLVVHDLGSGVADGSEPLQALRNNLEGSRERLGGLYTTTELLRLRGDGATMVVRTGTAQARWSGTWTTRDGVYSPGWGTGVLLDRDSSR